MISYEMVVMMHSKLEDLGLCMSGVRNNNGLLSAISGQQWYQDLFSQQLHVAYSINAGHLFNDGNKRTCFLVIKELSKFGYYFNDDLLADAILELACSRIDKDEFVIRVREAII